MKRFPFEGAGAHLPGFPSTLEKLLATKEWRGSEVTYPDHQTIRLTHPSGAEMRVYPGVFESLAQDKKIKADYRAAEKAAIRLCMCGRKVKGGMHKTPTGERHRFTEGVAP